MIRHGDLVRVSPESMDGRYACEPYRGVVTQVHADRIRIKDVNGATRDARPQWCKRVRRGKWTQALAANEAAAAVAPGRKRA